MEKISGYYFAKTFNIDINDMVKHVNKYKTIGIAKSPTTTDWYKPFYYRVDNKIYECYGISTLFSPGNFTLVTKEQIEFILKNKCIYFQYYDKDKNAWLVKESV